MHPSDIKSISIIGAGRVASQLALTLHKNNFQLREIYSRTIEKAKRITELTKMGKPVASLDFSTSQARVFIISVKDDAISKITRQIQLPKNSLIMHTSGTVSMDVLSEISSSFGIIYPLQTFARGEPIDFNQVPILIEGSNDKTLQAIHTMAGKISKQVVDATEADRRLLHTAAVFASNFTNRMIASAKEILVDTSLDYQILEPLVRQSVLNAFNSNPDDTLTGPAKRGDLLTIEQHLNLLKEKPELSAIYESITQAITSKFSSQN